MQKLFNLLDENQTKNINDNVPTYENDTIQPITGRIVSIKNQLSGGYKIFTLIAKGIYVKIDEEEENIKVAIDDADSADKKDDESSTKARLMTIVAIIIGVILAAVLLIIFL